MYDDIKVSIITPAHNDERFIQQTIESVLNQTHQNFEIILVDDFSTDKTLEVVESIKDNRIKVFKNDKNYGAAYSRNRALKEATGDYIAFLDGDDLWEPNKLEKQLAFMIENNYKFSATQYSVVDEEGAKTGKYVTGPKVTSHRKFMRMDYVGCLTVMFKREICPNLEIPNNISKRNDYALWLKISEVEKCYFLFEKLACYRRRKSSISSGKKIKLIRYHKELFQKLYGYNSFHSWCLAFRNAFYYVLKTLRYVKKEGK